MTQRTSFLNKSKVISVIAIVSGIAITYKFGLPAYNTYTAKRDLGKIGIPFSEQKFIESACAGDQGSVQLFIQAGMNINLLAAPGKKDSVPKSALHCAAIKRNILMAKSLIAQGADVNLADDEGNTPLFYLAKSNNYGREENDDGLDVAKLFIENKADLNKSGDAGSPLITAISANNFDLADLLIEKGADVKGVTKDGSTALIALIAQFRSSARSKVIDYATVLVKAGVDVNAANKNGITALITASSSRNIPLMETLLELGADPNKSSNGQSPIVLSLSYPEAFKLLVRHGADVNSKVNGQTLLHQALSSRNPMAISTLISTGKIDINSKNDNGETALHMAVSSQNNSLVQQLLVGGANPNLANNSLETPLIRAVNNNSIDIVRTLIEWNANVNMKDSAGNTPLFYAKRRADGITRGNNRNFTYNRPFEPFTAIGPMAITPAEMAPAYATSNPSNRYPPKPQDPRIYPSSGGRSTLTQHDPIVDMLIKAGGRF